MKKTLIIITYTISLLCLCLLLLYLTPIFFPSISTKYAENFDMDNFNEIKIGDNRHSVDNILGKPFYVSTENINRDSLKTNYWYSENRTSIMEYDKIIIQFYDDKVVNKVRVLDGD